MALSVGFIGVGNMGNPMAGNVLKAGFSMTVFDLNPKAMENLIQAGAKRAVSAKEVVDASDVSYSSIGEVSEGQPVCMLGLRLHILVAGATFNLHTRLAAAGGLVPAKE